MMPTTLEQRTQELIHQFNEDWDRLIVSMADNILQYRRVQLRDPSTIIPCLMVPSATIYGLVSDPTDGDLFVLIWNLFVLLLFLGLRFLWKRDDRTIARADAARRRHGWSSS